MIKFLQRKKKPNQTRLPGKLNPNTKQKKK